MNNTKYFMAITDEFFEQLWVFEGDGEIKHFTEKEKESMMTGWFGEGGVEEEFFNEDRMELCSIMTGSYSHYRPEDVVEITKEEYDATIDALGNDDYALVEELREQMVKKYNIEV